MDSIGQYQSYDYSYRTDGPNRKIMPGAPFNRKAFNPFLNPIDRAVLLKLRTQSIARFRYGWLTTSYRRLFNDFIKGDRSRERKVYIDFGCGDSSDRIEAKRDGLTSFGIDLFPPMFTDISTDGFIQADIAERLPLGDCSVDYATCHAVIALLKPSEREAFYKEVFRVMKIGGVFILSGLDLNNGYGFDVKEERARILQSANWQYFQAAIGGCIVYKDAVATPE